MKRNKLIKGMLAAAALFYCGLVLQVCINDKVVDFKKEGIDITAYLENNTLYSYSEFLKWAKVVGVDGMLNARGNYTCFVPTDSAVMQYYKEKGKGFEAMTSDEIAELVYGHIIKIDNPASDPIESKFFPNGTIGQPNMRSRFIQISYDSIGGIYVNQSSKILLKDQGSNSPYFVRNGVVHTIDRVLEPSRSLLNGLAEVHADRFSLFVEALKLTGLIDSLQTNINEDYDKRVKKGEIPEKMTSYTTFCDAGYCGQGTGTMKTPTSWLTGFTVMMESDETYRKAGINTIDDLRRFAEEHTVPQKPGTFDDPTNRYNSLNRFIAYHILDRTWDLNDFIPESWQKFYVPNAVLKDYTPTMSPLGMIEVQRDKEGPMLNKRKDGTAVRVLRIEKNNSAQNGFFHELDGILVYDEGVESDVLNKRIRMDVTSILSEMHTNRLAGNCGYIGEGGTGGRIFPKGYFKRMIPLSETTQIQYGGPMNSGWWDLHLDEFLIGGKYDVKLILPPLPPGTYEIRIGYTANNNRGVLQIYLDGQPLGIPLNMTITADRPEIGYVRPGNDPQDPDGLENDKMMRNRGYMKGPASVNYDKACSGQLRFYQGSLRRILTTARLDEGEHWLRFKSVEDLMTREFMFDWLEFVPTSYLEKEDVN